ncbi:MAG: radical SAM protein [Fibrobacteres bacterium]|nr:radical SAM protein [Fibrobacterota bacterium]
MNGRVANIQRFCLHDGPGIRTTVFLQGCPLQCAYCHNPAMQPREGGRSMSVEEVMMQVERDIPFYRSEGGLTLSGGEPLMQAAFSAALLEAARMRGINTCVETSGAGTSEAVRQLARHTDLFLWDVKFTEPDVVLPIDKLRAVESAGAGIRLRTVLVPGIDEEAVRTKLLGAARQLSNCEYVELLPYNELSGAGLLPLNTVSRG